MPRYSGPRGQVAWKPMGTHCLEVSLEDTFLQFEQATIQSNQKQIRNQNGLFCCKGIGKGDSSLYFQTHLVATPNPADSMLHPHLLFSLSLSSLLSPFHTHTHKMTLFTKSSLTSGLYTCCSFYPKHSSSLFLPGQFHTQHSHLSVLCI